MRSTGSDRESKVGSLGIGGIGRGLRQALATQLLVVLGIAGDIGGMITQ